MKQTILFTGKELKELWKTYKFLILCAVLLLFGMSSPLLASSRRSCFPRLIWGSARRFNCRTLLFWRPTRNFLKT